MTLTALAAPQASDTQVLPRGRRRMATMWGDPAGLAGAVILVLMLLACLLAPLLAPSDPIRVDLPGQFQGSTWGHPMGTDNFGRDILARVLHGGRVSLGVAVAATIVSLAISLVLGSIAGYLGGRIDDLVMRLVDLTLAFPRLVLAVLRRVRELEVEIPEHEECEVIVGWGMRADMGNNRILVGSERLMRDFGVPLPPSLPADLDRFRQEGETVLCVAVNESILGLIGVNDLIRPEARETLEALWRLGIRRTLLLTGDSAASAEIVARQLELAEYRGELFPEDKFALVRDLQEAGHRVAMVGDGINDAPSLALADLGIAMGTAGSDVAIEAADVALARDDIRDVATILDLSRHTLAVVRQNYALSLGVNAGGIIIGALGALNPILAALLHNLSTIAVVGNSARLIRYGRLALDSPAHETPAGEATADPASDAA